jgi:hypothetical protein
MSTITTRARPTTRTLEASAWALVLFQVVHGFTPADTDAEGYVGLVGGLFLLVASLTVVYGIRTGRPWAKALTGWTGLTVAVGFVLYHALPFKSPVTNPYLGEPVGPAAWISVALAVGAGAWAAYEAVARQP